MRVSCVVLHELVLLGGWVIHEGNLSVLGFVFPTNVMRIRVSRDGGAPGTISWSSILILLQENCNDEFRLRGDERAGSRKLRFAESVRYQLWDARPIGLMHGQTVSSRGGMDSLTHLPSGGEMQ